MAILHDTGLTEADLDPDLTDEGDCTRCGAPATEHDTMAPNDNAHCARCGAEHTSRPVTPPAEEAENGDIEF